MNLPDATYSAIGSVPQAFDGPPTRSSNARSASGSRSGDVGRATSVSVELLTAASEDFLQRITMIGSSLSTSQAAAVLDVGSLMAAPVQMGSSDRVGTMASFELSLEGLIEADPDLVDDYLMMLRLLLEEGDEGAVDTFVQGAHDSLKADAGGTSTSEVFSSGMERLGSVREISVRVSSEVRVALLDTIGELARVLSIGTVVFMGGSLVPRGGHNVLQPLAQSKPVIFGPHMHNFRGIVDIVLREQAALTVNDLNELVATTEALLSSETERQLYEARGPALIANHSGASQRMANHLVQLLDH